MRTRQWVWAGLAAASALWSAIAAAQIMRTGWYRAVHVKSRHCRFWRSLLVARRTDRVRNYGRRRVSAALVDHSIYVIGG
jgi:hypothetical protein